MVPPLETKIAPGLITTSPKRLLAGAYGLARGDYCHLYLLLLSCAFSPPATELRDGGHFIIDPRQALFRAEVLRNLFSLLCRWPGGEVL